MEVIYYFSEKYQKHSYILRFYPRELVCLYLFA